MALRKIVIIDEDLCNGCGECVPACAEGAIQIIDGKARLVADNLCDGLGACLGDCPMDAIKIEERDADIFDEVAVAKHLNAPTPITIASAPPSISMHQHHSHGGGCPGSKMVSFEKKNDVEAVVSGDSHASALMQWPVQMHLISPLAPYFKGSDLLLAADCCAFAMGDFHAVHLKGKSVAIACPKLDQGMDIYLQKLVSLIDDAKINTLTVMMMEVPCCGGLISLAKSASDMAARKVPIKKIVVGLKGDVLSEDWI